MRPLRNTECVLTNAAIEEILAINTQDVADELEKVTLGSGPVAQNIDNAVDGVAASAKKVEASYQFPT